MRVLSNVEMSWIAGGWDSVDEITVEPPSDDGGGSDDGNWDDPGGDDSNDYDEGGGGGGESPINVEVNVVDLLKYLQNQNWAKVGIDANELRMKTFGAYNGEKINPLNLNAVGTQNGITLYSYPVGDLGGSHVYYADRDSNGVVDTGVLYNPETGILAWDYNTDGQADEVVADLK